MKDRKARRPDWTHLVVAAITALLAVGITVTVQPDHTKIIRVGGGRAAATPATLKLQGKAGTARPATKQIPAPPTGLRTSTAIGLADHADSRNENVIPAGEAEKRQNGLEQLAHHDQLPLVSPDAAPSISGCTSKFVQDYSSRGGVRPRLIVQHYTVSHNTPGWGDVWSVVGIFNHWSYQASSNFVVDAEGHCAYIVRDTDKAWAQAAANPYSISIENVAYGNEGRLAPAQLHRDAQIIAHEEKVWGIPNQLGKVSNCLPVRPGIVDHGALGTCGGGHHDLRPFYGTSVVPQSGQNARAVGATIAAVKALSRPAVTAADRRLCRDVHAYRLRRHHTRKGTALFKRRVAREKARGFRCVAGHVKHR